MKWALGACVWRDETRRDETGADREMGDYFADAGSMEVEWRRAGWVEARRREMSEHSTEARMGEQGRWDTFRGCEHC